MKPVSQCLHSGEPNPLARIYAQDDGPHKLLFTGEGPTLSSDKRPHYERRPSTRFFLTQVTAENIESLGRLWSSNWVLTQHNQDYVEDYQFFSPGPFGLWRSQLSRARGGQFSVSIADAGADSTRESTCLFGAGYDGLCPVWHIPLTHTYTGPSIYLAPPSLRLPNENREESMIVGHVTAQNAVGTPQISNDGDGVLDELFLAFEARRDGFYELLIDTNQDTELNADTDLVLTGRVARGNQLIRWNGTDRFGVPFPNGTYRFELRLQDDVSVWQFDDIEFVEGTVGLSHQQSGDEWSPRQPFWNDSLVRRPSDILQDRLGDRLVQREPALTPARQLIRRWRQPQPSGAANQDRAIRMRQWSTLGHTVINSFRCGQCEGLIDELTISDRNARSNEDSDGDGLTDTVEVNFSSPSVEDCPPPLLTLKELTAMATVCWMVTKILMAMERWTPVRAIQLG